MLAIQMDERFLFALFDRLRRTGKVVISEQRAIKVFHCASYVFYVAMLFTRSSVDNVIE